MRSEITYCILYLQKLGHAPFSSPSAVEGHFYEKNLRAYQADLFHLLGITCGLRIMLLKQANIDILIISSTDS